MAGGTFIAIARAARTPLGLQPRRKWEKTFTDDRGPVWIWLRPDEGDDSVHAGLEYGPFTRRCDHACDSRGVFISLPVAGGNPPLTVTFDSVGWADFGSGEPPIELGIPVFSPFVTMTVTSRIRLLPKVITSIKASFAETEPGLIALARTFRVDDYYAHALLETVVAKHNPEDLRPATVGGSKAFDVATGADFKALRRARQLSVRQVVAGLNVLLPQSDMYRVSEDLERGAKVTVPLLRSRLDTLLDGDGPMCSDQVAVDDGLASFISRVLDRADMAIVSTALPRR